MKAAPGFLLGSLVESELLLNPYSGIETQLEKKESYMQSRVDKLHQYNEQAEAGVALTKSQDEARNKLDEVIKHQEYVKHLITMIHRDHLAYDKALKAADSILGSKLNAMKSKAISQSNVYSEILKQLAEPSSLQSFISGTNGAAKMNENELHAVLRLRWAFDPSSEGFSSLAELETRSAEAADVVTAILSEASTVVDKETGLQGKDVFALLESIKKSQFFMGGGFSCSSKSEESCTSTTADSANATESPVLSTVEESDRSYAEKPDSGPAIVNDSVDLSDHEELKSMGTTVGTDEVPSEKPTSASAPVTASESTDG
ncbi:hypothetical protein OESDEN_02447 [Oesophagostomum dentatum]|uniref:Caprin-1 dimerization domain-containing protein n=1 Tax=Oesophagostomum dentatum TaxID=61180 RepID=A0A0B1TJ68_OESDE|nr:hypothetical protein OESDEN_02447 [Oesophagostomum dentatum]